MLGFAQTGILLALIGIAWPIALHFFSRRKKQVQSVPSLRLFTLKQKAMPRVQVEDFLLMLMRCLLLAALVFLLAAPFLKSPMRLPLPSPELGVPMLALVIDDSASSLARLGQTPAIESHKTQALAHLKALPPKAKVSITLSSFPLPSPLVNRDEAIAEIGHIRAQMQAGDLHTAITAALEDARDHRSALVVLATRDKSLWQRDPFDAGAPTRPFLIQDTESLEPQAYIAKLQHLSSDESKQHWRVHLLLTENIPQSLKLQVRENHEALFKRELQASDFKRGHVDLSLDIAQRDRHLLAQVGKGEHPWENYHFVSSRGKARGRKVAILRDNDARSRALSQVVGFALAPISELAQVVEISGRDIPTEELEEVSTFVCIGRPQIHKPLLKWLEARRNTPLTWLFLPHPRHHGKIPTLAGMPRWQSAKAFRPSMHPLKLSSEAPRALSELYPLGLDKLPLSAIHELRWSFPNHALISTASGEDIAKSARLGKWNLVSFGLELSLEPGSLTYHPLFPHLIARLLSTNTPTNQAHRPVWSQSLVETESWLEGYDETASWLQPDGELQEISPDISTLSLSKVGLHRFEIGEKSLLRAVNHPRPSTLATLQPDELAKELDGLDYRLLKAGDVLGSKDFGASSAKSATRLTQYDLSIPLLIAVLFFLLCESGFLFLSWRRLQA